ncbi:hypothetical protein [Saccharicrinis sp. FJH54]|uniref:hypothetical protein n=1 Tax=Saccharicrinis sp. FJH54 TaxID=3344665 RepID=UPI0035D52849
MTKNTTRQLLIAISVLLLTSCLLSNSSGNSSTDIKEVLGSWNITKASLQKIKRDDKKTGDKMISSFTLNADSTAVVLFGESGNKKMEGTWIWQAEKKVGSKNFGLSLKSDVVIRVHGLYTLGLQLRKNGNKKNLVAGDYTFERQK